MVIERVRELTTKKGFIDAFWEIVNANDITHLAAYETLELEYESYFGKRRYKTFNSFRRFRDTPNVDEDREYMYVFYDPSENVTYLGISSNPEKLFRTMINYNSNLVYTTVRRNFTPEWVLEFAEDYRIGEKAYRLPPAIYHAIVGGAEAGTSQKVNISKGAVDLMIEYRGRSGVYVFEEPDGRILYIGVTTDLHQRPRSSFKTRFRYYPHPIYMKFYPCNKADAHVIETYLIAKHRPIFNRLGASSDRPTVGVSDIPPPTRRVRVK